MIRNKVQFCIIPRRLVTVDRSDGYLAKIVGWVWFQRAHLTKNYELGWVAFMQYQTPEYLDKCPCCNRTFKDKDSTND